MSKDKVKIKQAVTYDAAVAYLEDLVKSFKVGNIVVQQGEEQISLIPGENVELKVEAKEKKGKAKVELSIGWRVASGEEEETASSSGEPEADPGDD